MGRWMLASVPGWVASRDVVAELSAASGQPVAIHDRMLYMCKIVVESPVCPVVPASWKEKWRTSVRAVEEKPERAAQRRCSATLLIHIVQQRQAAEQFDEIDVVLALHDSGFPVDRIAALDVVRRRQRIERTVDRGEVRTAVHVTMATAEEAEAFVAFGSRIPLFDAQHSARLCGWLHCLQLARAPQEHPLPKPRLSGEAVRQIVAKGREAALMTEPVMKWVVAVTGKADDAADDAAGDTDQTCSFRSFGTDASAGYRGCGAQAGEDDAASVSACSLDSKSCGVTNATLSTHEDDAGDEVVAGSLPPGMLEEVRLMFGNRSLLDMVCAGRSA